MTTSKARLDEDRLIREYIYPDWDRYSAGRVDARIRGYGVSVWALIGHLRAIGGDVNQLAEDYELPREAVDAALAYYRQNKDYVDARLLLNSAQSPGGPPVQTSPEDWLRWLARVVAGRLG